MWTGDLSARTKTALLLGVLATLALLVWHRYAPSAGSGTAVGVVTTAPPPKVVERIVEKIKVVVKPGPERIVFLQKEPLAAALKMPELTLTSDNVISVATAKPHTGPTTIVSTLSPEGEGKILLRQEPPPWFQLQKAWEFDGRYLFLGSHVAEIDLRINPIHINARDGRMTVEPHLFGGIAADRDDNGLEARAGVGITLKW